MLLAGAASPADLERMTAARVAGEPLEYILGWADFGGLRIAVEPGVFVPRRRTRLLAAEALRLAPPSAVVLDLCCGAGALGAAIAAARADAVVFGADVDPVAARCARRNIRPDRVFEGDLFSALPPSLRGRLDVIVANAPYVPSDDIAMMPTEARDHEPRSALDGGRDGLDLHRRIAASAADWLTPTGTVLIETSERQGPATASLLRRNGFTTAIAHSEEHDGTAAIGTLAPGARHSG